MLWVLNLNKYERINEMTEGWTWLINSKKWHYFREGKSLCKKFLLLQYPEFEQGNDHSPDNCKQCIKQLEKEKTNE
jgi:hypothetical protein